MPVCFGDDSLREGVDLVALGPGKFLTNDGGDLGAGEFVDGSVQFPPLGLSH